MTTSDPTPRTNAQIGAPDNQRGMAMITVLIFSLVFIIGMLAFFTVAGYEANQAEVREHTTRAFFLADGAIERAKGELLRDGRWDDGYAWTNADGGRYKLTVSSTTWQGQPASRFYAESVFGRSKRDVEVFADISPPGFGIAILALGSITTRGNVSLVGHAHANGDMDGNHFVPGSGTFDGEYVLTPPPAFTEPDSFPGATYYFVTAERVPSKTLFVKDRNGDTLASFPFGTSPHSEITWDINNANVLTFDYKLNGPGPHALDDSLGVFIRQGADSAVVINFGQGTPTKHVATNLIVQASGNVAATIKPTIINARFTGTTNEDRLNKGFWVGGEIDLKTATTFAPRLCVSGIFKRLDKTTAQAAIGTPSRPCLTYIMGDVDWSAGQFTMYGTLIALGNMLFGGGTNLNYDSGFISCLPPSFRDNWPAGTSGSMKVLEWREPPPIPIS